jgi:signal transduction histidine kinase
VNVPDEHLTTDVDARLERYRRVAQGEHRAAAELRAEAEIRRELLVLLAHDLRAPIGALLHQAELLTMPELPSDVRQRSLDAIVDNAHELEHLLSALVEIERLALGPSMLEALPSGIAAFLADATKDHVAGSVRVILDDGQDIEVELDAAVLHRAFRSAMAAIRRAVGDIPLAISVDLADHEMVVTVAPERTAEAAATLNSLDLHIARALVELHGARLDVDDAATAVSVHLPLQPSTRL